MRQKHLSPVAHVAHVEQDFVVFWCPDVVVGNLRQFGWPTTFLFKLSAEACREIVCWGQKRSTGGLVLIKW